MQNLKGKITLNELDLSAFLAATLVNALGLSDQVPVKFDEKSKQLMSVQLELLDKKSTVHSLGGMQASLVYGELAISDFLVGLKNTT